LLTSIDYTRKIENVNKRWAEAVPALSKLLGAENFKDPNLKAIALSLEGLEEG